MNDDSQPVTPAYFADLVRRFDQERAPEPAADLDPNVEPMVPFVCGTMLISPDGDQFAEMWTRMEKRWLDWYARQPADQLTERHHRVANRLHPAPRTASGSSRVVTIAESPHCPPFMRRFQRTDD